MDHKITVAIGYKGGGEILTEVSVSDKVLNSYFDNAESLSNQLKLKKLKEYLLAKSYQFRKTFSSTLKLGEKLSIRTKPESVKNIDSNKSLPKEVSKENLKTTFRISSPQKSFGSRFPACPETAAITCFFNPCDYQAIKNNYHRFARQLSEQMVPLYTCEAVFGDAEPEINYGNVIHVKADHHLFIKENLLNIAEKIVPKRYTKILFIDCDFLFSEPDWAWEASRILDKKPAVQCMRKIIDLDEDGEVSRTMNSIAHKFGGGSPPGGGWGVHREIFTNFGGLYDKLITGGGDMVHTWGGFIGKLEENDFFINYYNSYFRASMKKWFDPVYRYIRGDIGVIQADSAHLFHGTRERRQYRSRTACVLSVDPEAHLRYNDDGVICWNDEAPREAIKCMEKYFLERQEDSSSQGIAYTVDPDTLNWNDSWSR